MLRRDSGERVRKELPFAGYSVVKDLRTSHHEVQIQIVVENTGLEPVTSWLQTRRSPS